MQTLAAGLTTVRNLGDANGVIRSLRDAIGAGKVAGPRILTANTSISATAGHADPTPGFRPQLHDALALGNVCDGVEYCRRAVRLQVAAGADVTKMTITGGVNSRIGTGLGGQMFEDEDLRRFRESGAYCVRTLSTVNDYLEQLAANPDAYSGEVL